MFMRRLHALMSQVRRETTWAAPARVRTAILCSAAAAAVMLAPISTPVASAATQDGYPTATVEYGATARSLPYLNSDTWGYVVEDKGATVGSDQTTSMMCWYDGDNAKGNYQSPRWFKVLVYTSDFGYDHPHWFFVHSSYVTHQPTVRQCEKSPAGLW